MKKVRGGIFAHQEKENHPEKLHEDWSEKAAKDGLGPCESVERPSSWHCACGKAQVEETNGGSSRKEGIGVALTFHGSEEFGSGRRTFHDGHAGLGRTNLDGKMGKRAKRGLEEADF